MRFAIVLLPLLLSACMTSPIVPSESAQAERIEYPQLDVPATAALGERIAAFGSRSTSPAIRVSEAVQFNKAEGEASIMTCAVTVQPVLAFRRGRYDKPDFAADCFGPVSYSLTTSDGRTNFNCPGQPGSGDICRTDTGRYFLAVLAATVELKQDFDKIEYFPSRVLDRGNNLVQEMVYGGRVGANLKLIYREFSDDVQKPSFVQEMLHDMEANPVVEFKGLRMKLLEADNARLEYEVLSNFRPPISD